MRESLKHICDKFASDREAIRSAFSMEGGFICAVCNIMFADTEIIPSVEHFKELKALIKQNTGAFSTFRGLARPAIISYLYVNEAHKDAASGLKEIMDAHTALKEYFWDSQYLPLASLLATRNADFGALEAVCARTSQLYELMKERHSVITSSDDLPLLTLLAASEPECENIEKHIEECYRLLKPEFYSHNSVQALACVLTLFEGEPEEKVKRTLALYNEFKRRGRKYGTVIELATLGALAMLPNTDAVINDTLEVDACLEEQGGYGAIFGIGKQQRLMHAGMLMMTERICTASESDRDFYFRARGISLCAAICGAVSASQNGN